MTIPSDAALFLSPALPKGGRAGTVVPGFAFKPRRCVALANTALNTRYAT
jgi:hypothetical protein